MKIAYDESVDILYIRLREGDYKESDAISEGVIVDYDNAGKPMAIEILDASKMLSQVDRVTIEHERTREPV